MEKKVLDNIKQILAMTLPKQAQAMLYGSQARGDARQDSDWDILIVIDKDRLLPQDYDTITYPLTKLGWELGTQINPMNGKPAASPRSIIMYQKTRLPYEIEC